MLDFLCHTQTKAVLLQCSCNGFLIGLVLERPASIISMSQHAVIDMSRKMSGALYTWLHTHMGSRAIHEQDVRYRTDDCYDDGRCDEPLTCRD